MKSIHILGLSLLTLALVALVAVVGGLAGPLLAESNDRPNRPASGLCTQVGIDVVTAAFKYENGIVQASGAWAASGGPAKGVLLEYRLDSDRYRAETQPGSAGKWTYSETFKDCGHHVLEVVAFPSVVEDGRTVYCLPLGKTVKSFFEAPCQGMTARLDCAGWACKDGLCSGTCTGDATGGQWGYVALFGVDDANYAALPSSQRGPWTRTVTCAPGQRISFKARDRLGAGGFSPIAERPCGQ
ncbi:MAG TPA: hypothetical protein VGR07_20625 [Thermoanaerobaculia bacterium]|jgi:hypothetical protein|nr:hypothetical protein [Thermoanaerobaculia bacterium]